MKNKKIAAAVLSTFFSALSVHAADQSAPPAPAAPPAPESIPAPPAPPQMITAMVDYPESLNAKTEKGAFLGVSTSRAPIAILKQLKIKSGLLIESVVAGSPAEKAGLKATDILEKMGDQILINPAQLEGLIRMNKPGDSVTLSLIHEGDRNTITTQLTEHDVLAMTDSDPQLMADQLFKNLTLSNTGPARINVVTTNPTISTDVFNDPSVKSAFKVMTMVDKSDLSDDGKKSANFESQFSDGKKQLTIVHKDSGRVLTIKDMDGKQLFQGPVDTEAQQNAIPKDLQPEFREMQKLQTLTHSTTRP